MASAMATDRITSAFDLVYQHKLWDHGAAGGSGSGSTARNTHRFSQLLVHILLSYNISSMLDIPCGSFSWMPDVLRAVDTFRKIDGLDGRVRDGQRASINYTGVDIVGSLIETHRQAYSRRNPEYRFEHANAARRSTLHRAGIGRHDLVLCRDFFFHLSSASIHAAVRNLKQTGSVWLLASHFPNLVSNTEQAQHIGLAERARGALPSNWTGGLDAGGVRFLNLRKPPFNFPPPAWEFVEVPAGRLTKAIGMWRFANL